MTTEQFLLVLSLLLISVVGGVAHAHIVPSGKGVSALLDAMIGLALWIVSAASFFAAFYFTFHLLRGG